VEKALAACPSTCHGGLSLGPATVPSPPANHKIATADFFRDDYIVAVPEAFAGFLAGSQMAPWRLAPSRLCSRLVNPPSWLSAFSFAFPCFFAPDGPLAVLTCQNAKGRKGKGRFGRFSALLYG
jgi:hypothetical protein